MPQKTIVCEVCGKERKVKKYWAKYCSNICRQIGWALGKKKEIDSARRSDVEKA